MESTAVTTTATATVQPTKFPAWAILLAILAIVISVAFWWAIIKIAFFK